MAKLSKKAVNDFQKLILQKSGIELSYEDAEFMAMEWLQFCRLIMEPIPKEADGTDKEKIVDRFPQPN